MTTATLTKPAKLPPLLLACCDVAGPLKEPFLAGRWVAASDGRAIARMPAARCPADTIHPLASDVLANPGEVDRLFDAWRGDGRVLTLPAGIEGIIPCPRCDAGPDRILGCPTCDGEGSVLNRRRVTLGPGIALAAYRVALLADRGVREVLPGLTPRCAVRFAHGDIEGLMMPLVEVVR